MPKKKDIISTIQNQKDIKTYLPSQKGTISSFIVLIKRAI